MSVQQIGELYLKKSENSAGGMDFSPLTTTIFSFLLLSQLLCDLLRADFYSFRGRLSAILFPGFPWVIVLSDVPVGGREAAGQQDLLRDVCKGLETVIFCVALGNFAALDVLIGKPSNDPVCALQLDLACAFSLGWRETGLVTEFAGGGNGKLAVCWVVVQEGSLEPSRGKSADGSIPSVPSEFRAGDSHVLLFSASGTNVVVISFGLPPKARITERFCRSFVVVV